MEEKLLSEFVEINVGEEKNNKTTLENEITSKFFNEVSEIIPVLKEKFNYKVFFRSYFICSLSFLIFLLDFLLFLLMSFGYSDFSDEIPLKILVMFGAKVTRLIKSGQIWRIITANFLHANLTHLFSNMIGQLILGPIVERILGKWQFFFVYLFSGVIGFLVSTAYIKNGVSVGASGCLSGLFSIYFAFYILNYSNFQKAPLARWAILFVNFSFLISNGIFEIVYYKSIDHSAHIAGYLTGFLLFIILIKPFETKQSKRKLKILAIFILIFSFSIYTIFVFCW